MGVMVQNHVKLAGVQANFAKCIVTGSSRKLKYDPKMLFNMTNLLQTNRMQAVALIFEATLDCHQQCVK